MNPPCNLRREFLESFTPKSARGTLVRGPEGWRNGEVVTSVQGDGLTRDPEIAIELRELTTHPVEARQRGAIALVAIRVEVAIERCLDD